MDYYRDTDERNRVIEAEIAADFPPDWTVKRTVHYGPDFHVSLEIRAPENVIFSCYQKTWQYEVIKLATAYNANQRKDILRLKVEAEAVLPDLWRVEVHVHVDKTGVLMYPYITAPDGRQFTLLSDALAYLDSIPGVIEDTP